jgi:hypothetical protein
MAINYEARKEEIKSIEITPNNLRYIERLEEFIDNKILDNFDGYNTIAIDSDFINFLSYPTGKTSFPIETTNLQRSKMFDELINRYFKAGWGIIEDQVTKVYIFRKSQYLFTF